MRSSMRSPRQEAQVRIRVKRNPRPFFKNLILLAVALYVIFLIVSFAQSHLLSRLAKVQQIQEGVIQNTISVSGTLVRNEEVINSPRSGKLKVILNEGERVRVGQVFAQVIAPSLDNAAGETTYNITAPKAGMISYHLDGLEKIYSPGAIKELDLEKVKTLESKSQVIENGVSVEEGKPVAKILNNLEPLTIICDLGDHGKTFEKSDKTLYNVYFGDKTKEIYKAEVTEKNFRGQQNLVLLDLFLYSNELVADRKINFNIITDRYEGYYIPKDALVIKEGQKGIFTVYKERVRWKQVEVEGEAGGNVLISGVTPDLRVIVNPQLVKEGYSVTSP